MLSRVESDSGLSSTSGDTCGGPPPGGSGAPMTLADRFALVHRQMSNIRSARSLFCQEVHDLKKAVERMSLNVSEEAQARERSLKAMLWEIGNARILELDRQLSICREADRALSCLNSSGFSSPEAVQTACDAYSRSIGFIDSENLRLRKIFPPEVNLLGGDGAKGGGRLGSRRKGEGAGRLKRPWGVCSDRTGRIVVADRGNDRILVLDKDGRCLLKFGKTGSGIGEFRQPTGVAVDSSSRIIVADKDNHRVQIFRKNGCYVREFGEWGSRRGAFWYPWGVAVNEEDWIAVSEKGNQRVQLFDKEGDLRAVFDLSCPIEGLGRGVSLRGVAFESKGDILVTDLGNGCVLRISKRFAMVQQWRRSDEDLVRPYSVACDGQGAVAVVDRRKRCVQVFDERGKLLRSVSGKGPVEYDIEDVCFHSSGRIVVTRVGDPRVEVL